MKNRTEYCFPGQQSVGCEFLPRRRELFHRDYTVFDRGFCTRVEIACDFGGFYQNNDAGSIGEPSQSRCIVSIVKMITFLAKIVKYLGCVKFLGKGSNSGWGWKPLAVSFYPRYELCQKLYTPNDCPALDAIVFDALDFTQGEWDGVYEVVVNLVESRLRKSKSLKGKP